MSQSVRVPSYLWIQTTGLTWDAVSWKLLQHNAKSEYGYTDREQSSHMRTNVPEVGIRELRDNLSRYLNQVRDGTEVTVTDHGRAVARIVPLELPRRLDQLIDEGLVIPARTTKRNRPSQRIDASGPVSPLAADQSR